MVAAAMTMTSAADVSDVGAGAGAATPRRGRDSGGGAVHVDARPLEAAAAAATVAAPPTRVLGLPAPPAKRNRTLFEFGGKSAHDG